MAAAGAATTANDPESPSGVPAPAEAASAGSATAPAAAAFLLLRLLLPLLLPRWPPLLLAWRLAWLLPLLWCVVETAASYVPGFRGRRSMTKTVTLSRVPRSRAAFVRALAERLTAATPQWPDACAACEQMGKCRAV